MAWTWPVLFTKIRLRSKKPLLPRSTLPTSDWSKTTPNQAIWQETTPHSDGCPPQNHSLSGVTKCSQVPKSDAASANVKQFSVAKAPPGCFIIHIILWLVPPPNLFTLDMQLRWSRILFFSHIGRLTWPAQVIPRAPFYVIRSRGLLSHISRVSLAKEL